MGEPRTTRRRKPANTPEGRENQLISLAADVAEKQLREGTASAQVITHFLKLGSSRERVEQERLKNDNLLISAKLEAMASASRIESMYEEALNAMRSYTGREIEETYDDDQAVY